MYVDHKLRSRLLRNPELANVIPLKPGVGQNIAMHASPTASIFLFFFFFFFFFFLVGCPKLYHLVYSFPYRSSPYFIIALVLANADFLREPTK